MHDKKIILLLALIMTAVSLIAGTVSMAFLYQASFEKEREHLSAIVRSQARHIEAVARFDALYSRQDHPQGAAAATLSQVRDAYAHYRGFGQTGTFLVGQREDGQIRFLLNHVGNRQEHIAPVAWESEIAEPMRRALQGETGLMVGLDYRGETVLAAYEPVKILEVGIVAKIDLDEIRAPFVRAATIALGVMLIAIAAGSLLFFRLFDPIIEKIRQQNRGLEKSRRSLAKAQEIAHLGNWDWNIVSNELTWSDEIYRIFGCNPQTFGATYDAFLGFIHPQDRDKVANAVHLALQEKQAYEVEHRIVRPDGTQRIVQEQGEVIRDAQGNPIQMLGTVHDITERKRAEERLILSDRVIRNTSEGIVITKSDGSIVDANDAFTAITGYTREEVLGKNPRIMKSGRQDQGFYEQMWQQITTRGRWSGEIWDRKKNGTEYPKWLSINAVKDEQGQTTHYIGIFSDISKAKATEEKLQQLAFYDSLTRLPNRALCQNRLEHEIKMAQRHGTKLAVLYMDLDRFKYVNDTLGHAIGDRLLVAAAERIKECMRETDTVARLGGDEFTVILNDIEDAADIERVASCIIERLSDKFVILGNELNVGASIGISLYPDNGTTLEQLTKSADVAMYRAKEEGKNTYRFFNYELHAAMQRRVELDKKLRASMQQDELEIYYQPKVDLRSGTIIGMEALLRWRCPDTGLMITPTEFIPVAEETGLILSLGEWVLRKACEQNVAWITAGYKPLRVAVNLSARQFEQKDLVERVASILIETGLEPRFLELEITETVLMCDEQKAIDTLTRLGKLGVQLAIDDFGTGYSSLASLKRLPIQTLKIDKSFINDLEENIDSAAIVSAIISMANSLDLEIIAEGVETKAQMDYLRREGCDEMQGFYYSKAIPTVEFCAVLEKEEMRQAKMLVH